MSCPHGLHSDPATCSQCQGARPRVVTFERGRLLIDGSLAKRHFMPPADVPGSMVEARARGTRNSARATRARSRSNQP